MAKLKLRLPNLDDVPEALRDYYREVEGGGFMIDYDADPDGYGIDNLPALRGKLDEALRKKTSLEGKAPKKEDGSLYTIEEIKALADRLDETTKLAETLKDKDKSTEQKFEERLRAQLKPLHDQLAERDQRITAYREKVLGAEKAKVIDKVIKTLGAPIDVFDGVIRDAIGREIQVAEGEDGQVVANVINPEDGKPRYSALTGQDGHMSIDEFAKSKDLRERFGKFLQGDGKEGAGPIGRDGPAPTRRGKTIVLPHNANQTEFEAAMAEAQKAGGEVAFAEGDA